MDPIVSLDTVEERKSKNGKKYIHYIYKDIFRNTSIWKEDKETIS